MNRFNKFGLPFKWREFAEWYRGCGKIDSENANGRLKIFAADFATANGKLTGISVRGEVAVSSSSLSELYLCAFLADLSRKQLFEPFIGNPDSFIDRLLEPRLVRFGSAGSQKFEVFIPEEGWILPSIWQFLMKSIGLRQKTCERLPDILVLAFVSGSKVPVFSTSVPFDYYGSARQLQKELALSDFFRQLRLLPGASEAEVHKAYIATCRRFQTLMPDCASSVVWKRRNSTFQRIKQGYQVWAERLRLCRNEY